MQHDFHQYTAKEDFWIPHPQPAEGSKRCAKSRSGDTFADFRATIAEYMLLGIVKGVIYIL